MKLKLLLFYVCLVFAGATYSQSLAINTTGNSAAESAILDISSNKKGLLIPRMNTVQRDAIVAPDSNLLIVNTDCNCINQYTGSKWVYYVTSLSEKPLLPRVLTYTTNSIWTKPARLHYIIVRLCAGGGGGGGCQGYAAGTGAGGGYSEKIIPADSLSSFETILVGKGGLGGLPKLPGQNGGLSSFGAHLYATGGEGGKEQYFGLNNTEGSYGGMGFHGDINIAGDPGGGVVEGGQTIYYGGSSHWGGGAPAQMRNAGLPGITALGYGGGGSGGVGSTIVTNLPGGNGGSGLVVITEYYF